MDVLVTYATKHGSTRQVAELITATLREQEARVEPAPARAARVPGAGYDLVVGGALYSGRRHHHPRLHPAATVVFGGVDPSGHDHPRRDLRDRAAVRRCATPAARQGPVGGAAAGRP